MSEVDDPAGLAWAQRKTLIDVLVRAGNTDSALALIGQAASLVTCARSAVLVWVDPPGIASQSAGLLALVAHGGQPVQCAAIGSDSRAVLATDCPRGGPNDRWMAVRVPGWSLSQSIPVLVAERSFEQPPFVAEDLVRLEAVAGGLGRLFKALGHDAVGMMGSSDVSSRTEPALIPDTEAKQISTSVFRQEAIDHYRSTNHGLGQMLRLGRFVERWFYPLFIILSVGGYYAYVSLKRLLGG